MTSCAIYPIAICESFLDKSLMTYRMNFGQQIRSVGYVWFIDGIRENVLVDTGADIAYAALRGIPAKEIQSLEKGLQTLGLSFDDIDTVILTHLHHDHTAGVGRFARARLLVQKAELDFAMKPHPSIAAAYPKELLRGVEFETIEGDVELCREISILFTPGHSPGGQSVLVRGTKKTAVISGLCTIAELFEPSASVAQSTPVITPGMHTDALLAYDSLLRIKKAAEIVIANHDPVFQSGSRIDL
jgi:N-acyl homoserine lactone hydrolase